MYLTLIFNEINQRKVKLLSYFNYTFFATAPQHIDELFFQVAQFFWWHSGQK